MNILPMNVTAPSPPSSTDRRRSELDRIVATARVAAAAFRELDQAAVDRIVWAMVAAGLEAAVDLAELAFEETGFGVFEDKVVKNYIATEFLYEYLKDKKSVGVIGEEPERGIQYVAEPIGVVLGVLPITNPTSTLLFKAIVAAKTRNAIVFRPSARTVRSAMRAAEVMRAAGEGAGLPKGALQIVPDPDLEASRYLFHHPGVDLIWATGGKKMVEAASSSGKPVITVGPGNAPVYLHRTADIPMAVVDILISKTFDASVICPAEQTCVVDEAIYDAVVAELVRMGARLLGADDVRRLVAVVVGPDGRIRPELIGQSCSVLARAAGVDATDGTTKVLLAPLPTDLEQLATHPLVQEKLMPVLGLVRSPSVEHALRACEIVTEHGGLGHTSAIYSRDESVIDRYALAIRTGRILVNAPTAVGALGGIYNSLTPTFSLGCGTWGGSATTENVNYRQLLNVKTVARRVAPPQWFRVPSDTYFNLGAIENLRRLKARCVLVVTDPGNELRGAADEVRANLPGATVHVFSQIEPEPTEAQMRAGVAILDQMRPDMIVALGGGSVIDAAKVMRLFYENPKVTVRELALPFLDARKRVAQDPQTAHRVRLVGVPTTAGTGSEVSPAAVIRAGDKKLTLVDYSLVPDIAIVDPHFTLSLPRTVTADSGIDALTHAVEAYVSIFASPYTDALCVQAIRLVLDALPRACADGTDIEARTAMANAATIAGLAFSNAFVGLAHALAHAVGGRFDVAHGRANGVFLPWVMRYNADLPSKFMPAPGYHAYVAPGKFADIGRALGIGGQSDDEIRRGFFERVDRLLDTVGIPRSLAEAGVPRAAFEAALPELAKAAFSDPSIRTNPRIPLLKEITSLLEAAYRGR
jgi:acetaldehyde dehydrogenase/alcohol dehydrogenase